MSRRMWGASLLAMLPIAGVVAFIVWWLSRRPRSEAPEPRAILVEQGPPRSKPKAEEQPVKAEENQGAATKEKAEVTRKPAPSRRRTPSKGDDLKAIEGIGPKVAALLESNGVRSYAQLANTSIKKLETMLESANLRFIKPGSWPEQARLAAAGEWEKLKGLQGELKGGRRS